MIYLGVHSSGMYDLPSESGMYECISKAAENMRLEYDNNYNNNILKA